MQLTLLVVLSAAAAAIAVVTVGIALRYRDTPGMTALVAFNIGVAIWTGGNALQAAATTLPGKLFWVNVQYVGIAIIPLAVFAFAATIAGYPGWLTGRRLVALALPLAALVLLSWTNPLHGLVRASARVVTVNGDRILERTFGPAFWAGWAYSNLLNVVASLLVLRAVVYADEVLRRRTIALMVGASVPWLAHFLFLSGVSPVEPEVFFSVTGAAFVYAVLRFRRIESVPVARDAVLETLDEGVMVIDDAGRVVDVNDAARTVLGLAGVSLVGHPIEDVLGDHPTILDAYRTGGGTDDVVVETGDGGATHVDVRISSLDDRIEGEGAVMVFRDVTDLRERERTLERQTERLELVADTLAHDLRNPLNVARGNLEYVRDGDEAAYERVERAHERIAGLIDQTLAVARQRQQIDPESLELATVAERAWETVGSTEATLDIETGGIVHADEELLSSLLENVFRNAIEHASRDVTVRIGRTNEVDAGDAARRHRGFFIEDDGPGIEPDAREEVFEHGFSTRSSGTGFGLTTVHAVAEAHGWAVTVTESESGGARFEFVPDDDRGVTGAGQR